MAIVVKSCSVSEEDEDYLMDQRISLTKLVRQAIEALKENKWEYDHRK